MNDAFLTNNIQNLPGTGSLDVPKQRWGWVWDMLVTRKRVTYTALSCLPAVLTLPLFGVSEIFFFLLLPTIIVTLLRVKALRNTPKRELRRYQKARGNVPLGVEELQALNLCARFTFRDHTWYHTYENQPFWDRKAGYDDPAFDRDAPYYAFSVNYSNSLMRTIKRDWDITTKKELLTTVYALRDGQTHRCSVVTQMNKNGFNLVYDILSDLTGAPHDSFHPVFFPDQDHPDAEDKAEQSLADALAQFGLDEKVFLDAIRAKCDEFDDPASLKLESNAREKIFQIVRHIGRLSVRNDARNIFLFDTEVLDQILYPQGEEDLISLGWGFDLSRGMFLLRCAYAAGMLTREELRAELPAFRQIASVAFPNWESYFCSETLGFLAWNLRVTDKEADAFNNASQAATQCHSVMEQGFPIGKTLPWPAADDEARARFAQIFEVHEKHPFFMPETLGVTVEEDSPLDQLVQSEGATLH